MAKTAAKRAQSRVGGGGRRRSLVDSRQMELSFASPPAPLNPCLPEPKNASKSYPADLFEACSVDAKRAKAPAPCTIEAPPVAANDPIDSEALALAAIVDVLIEMWREASGEDLRPKIFPRQNL
jgi:hypothetical protein